MKRPARTELSRLPSRLLSPGRNKTKAEVRVFEIEGKRIVVKDFRARGLLVRSTIGRFSIARECRAYGRLASLAGVPEFHGRIDAHAMACAFAHGRPLPEHPRRSLPEPFFEALAALLVRVHERGVAIADLHHRNVIVEAATGAPVLIDFSLAFVRPSPWNLPGRWLFAQAQQLDRIALARMRQRYQAPDGVRLGAEGQDPERLPGLYRWGRTLKRILRRRARKA